MSQFLDNHLADFDKFGNGDASDSCRILQITVHYRFLALQIGYDFKWTAHDTGV